MKEPQVHRKAFLVKGKPPNVELVSVQGFRVISTYKHGKQRINSKFEPCKVPNNMN